MPVPTERMEEQRVSEASWLVSTSAAWRPNLGGETEIKGQNNKSREATGVINSDGRTFSQPDKLSGMLRDKDGGEGRLDFKERRRQSAMFRTVSVFYALLHSIDKCLCFAGFAADVIQRL